jgi:hypothetical protein
MIEKVHGLEVNQEVNIATKEEKTLQTKTAF